MDKREPTEPVERGAVSVNFGDAKGLLTGSFYICAMAITGPSLVAA